MNNNFENLLVFLFIGMIAGWLAGLLVKGRGFGVLGDILVGIIGAEIDGWIFGKLGLSNYGFAGAVFMAFVGAVVLLAIIKLVVGAAHNRSALPVILLLLVCGSAHAATTVTVDDNNTVQVHQSRPQTVVREVVTTQPSVFQPVIVPVADNLLDFEGEIEKIDRSTRTIDVIDTEGRTRQVMVTQETIDTYRTGDFVRIHPVANVREVVFIREESKRDLEGRIINVDSSHNTIIVRDTRGRDRRVELKQGMISTYKVDDYVRIHLMADLREAKMIRTIK